VPLGHNEAVTASAGTILEAGNAKTLGEPPLQDLLDDPMMSLVWRRDGLEPQTARAMVQALQAMLRSRHDGSAATHPHSGIGTALALG
jgi:hypothetical protein